jgi:FKBP-type peptidyl-prolyl cis-trans isomerase FkpA
MASCVPEAVGAGAPAAAGDEVSVHYTGWLYDQDAPDKRGTRFDSSRDRGEPFVFRLGVGRVIRGWDEGVAGMRVGGKRELHVPAWLGYGTEGAGRVIPPGLRWCSRWSCWMCGSRRLRDRARK